MEELDPLIIVTVLPTGEREVRIYYHGEAPEIPVRTMRLTRDEYERFIEECREADAWRERQDPAYHAQLKRGRAMIPAWLRGYVIYPQ